MLSFKIKKQDEDNELYIRLRESVKLSLSPKERREQYISYLRSIADDPDLEQEKIEKIVDEVYG